MTRIFLIIHLRILLRTLRQLVPALPVLLAILVAVGVVLWHLPLFYVPGLFLLLMVCYQQYREDGELLRILSGHRPVRQYAVEYILFSVPFVLLSLLAGKWVELPVYLLTPLVALLPRARVRYVLMSHPLLMKGSYEFISGFRQVSVVYLLLLIGCVMGGVYANVNLVIVCIFIWMFFMMGFHFVSFRQEYLLNYSSARSLLTFKLRAIFCNTVILLAPMLAVMLVSFPHGSTVVDVLKLMLLAMVLCCQMFSLRCLSQNLLVNAFVLILFVLPMAIGSYAIGGVLAADVASVFILLYMVYQKLWKK